MRGAFAGLLVLGLSLQSLSLRAEESKWLSETQSIMGTSVSVTLWHEDGAQAKQAIAAVMEDMRRIDKTLSPYIDSSELSRLNQKAALAPVSVSDELWLLVDKSLYFSEISEGAFDITFASVGWYYDYREKKEPSDSQREKLLPAINYRLLERDPKTQSIFYAHKNIRIDLGGVAKGHAVDRAAAILHQYGVKNATVSAGGDSRVIGDKRGKPWMIGIKNPRGKGESNAIVLPLEDIAVSTSGDYERYFIDEASGERIHHILNPKTGKSAQGLASVTILGPKGIDADPLSTTVFVLGVKKGLALVNSMPDFDCIIIDAKGQVHYSEGLAQPG